MTRGEVSSLVALLAAAYPAVKVGEDTAEVYEALLSDLDFDQSRAAVLELVKSYRFLPTVAEIRRAVARLNPRPALPSFDPRTLPSRAEHARFYTVRRFPAATFREPPRLSEGKLSDEEIQRRHELLKAQARELVEQESNAAPAAEEVSQP